MDRGRQGNGFGPSPLAWSEIHAFFQLLGIYPTSLDLRLIRAIDRAFIHVFSPKEPTK